MNFKPILCNFTQDMNAKFTMAGKVLSAEEVFAETGFLPALAKRADQLCLLCMGYGIGVSFVDADSSILGIKVQFDEVTPDILRLIFLYDVIAQIVKAAPDKNQVSLDDLMYD
jgi:intracellular multiplication protein IcmS